MGHMLSAVLPRAVSFLCARAFWGRARGAQGDGWEGMGRGEGQHRDGEGGGGQPHTCVGKQAWGRACGCTAETHGYVCVCVRAFWDVVDEWDSGSVCVESFGDLSFESFGSLGF